MTAAWAELEVVNKDNGTLEFYPRSHHLGTLDFDEIGLCQKEGPSDIPEASNKYFGGFYGGELVNCLESLGLKPKIALDMKYEQTLIWAAGLAHGGSEDWNEKL